MAKINIDERDRHFDAMFKRLMDMLLSPGEPASVEMLSGYVSALVMAAVVLQMGPRGKHDPDAAHVIANTLIGDLYARVRAIGNN